MRQLSEALQLDEQYMALHPANFRKCISEEEKERYKKQLYNIFTRRNSHIQDDVQQFQRQWKDYRSRQPPKRVVRSRNIVVSRPSIKEYLKTDATSHLLEVRAPATANISLDCEHFQQGEESKLTTALIFSSRQCIPVNKSHFQERRSHLVLQDQNKHSSNKDSGNTTLAMIGMKMRRPTFTRRFHRISAEEQELLIINPEDKENGEVLPGIFRTKEALVKFTKNCNPLRAASPKKCRRENSRHRLMQGLLYLQRVHKKAEEYEHVLMGHKVPHL